MVRMQRKSILGLGFLLMCCRPGIFSSEKRRLEMTQARRKQYSARRFRRWRAMGDRL
jgi:hypothetical protein